MGAARTIDTDARGAHLQGPRTRNVPAAEHLAVADKRKFVAKRAAVAQHKLDGHKVCGVGLSSEPSGAMRVARYVKGFDGKLFGRCNTTCAVSSELSGF